MIMKPKLQEQSELKFVSRIIPIPRRIEVDTLNVKEYISAIRDRVQLTINFRIYWKQENLYFKT